VWGLARALNGRVLLRIEDHDRGRSTAAFERGILDDLAWLGLDADDVPLRQRERSDVYNAALALIARHDARLVYPCICSRRDIGAITPDVFGAELRYPGTCRTRAIDPGSTPARRVVMAAGSETFDDLVLGEQAQDPSQQCGDVLVRDRNGYWTYQFAVVVDDRDQRVDVVIRGADLLDSTGRQIRLARLLGRAVPPHFLHHGLVLRDDGSKLSKSAGDTGIDELRSAGWSPSRVLGEAARLAGLSDRAQTISAGDLPGLFVA
jgi:glutamyl/glutaminyl-tRNA synthetase